MGAKGKKNRLGENYETLDEEWKNERSRPKRYMDRCTTRLCRPLRIFQFFTTLLLFAMIVYMTAMPYRHLTDLASILLIILTASYLFFMSIDMISQFDSHGLPDSPMFLFSFLGMFLFAIAGGLMVHYKSADNNFWALTLAKILCFVVSALFLIEVTMLLAYWRHKCLTWAKCYPYTPAGDCGQRELKTLFSGTGERDIDIEIGRCDLSTSISHCAVPLEMTIDTAVAQHGTRKINIGHRRQYIDQQSSVPALSIVQIAQIQTECEPTVINECQTQRIETREIIVQTNSRCELCNRQIEDRPLSPPKLSSPPPSLESQSLYSPSPRLTQTPYSSQLPLIAEPIPYNASTPIKPEVKIQGPHCAICPAYMRMMREDISSPCCQSCNCGAIDHQRSPVPYLLDHQTSQLRDSDVRSAHWSQPEAQRTPRSTRSTLKPTDSESPTTTNEKSDAERSDIATDEGSRYRPSKKITRPYEIRPCPAHEAVRAARIAGLPETVTKVTSICTRRNKRTQMPKKNDASISRDKDGNKVKEDRTSGKNNEEKIDNSKSPETKIDSVEKIRDKSKSIETIDGSSEDRVKLISDIELRRRLNESRKSSYDSPKKLYRNSETPPLPRSKDPTITSEISDRDVASRSTSRNQDSSARINRKPTTNVDRSEIRDSDKIVKVDSWFGDESMIKEEPDEDQIDHDTSLRTKFRKIIQPIDKSANLDITENLETMNPENAIYPTGGPILRLRLDKSSDDPKLPSERSNEALKRGNIVTESRTTLRSRSRGLPSIAGSEISMIERSTSETSKIRPSDEHTMEPAVTLSRESSIKSYREVCQCHHDVDDDEYVNTRRQDDMRPTRLRDEEITSEYMSSGTENEEIIEKSVLSVRQDISTSSRVTRTKSILRKDGAS